MKTKLSLLIGLLILGTMLISACQPVTPVASAANPVGSDTTSEVTNYVENDMDTGFGYGNGPGMDSGECDGTGQHQGGAGHGHSGEMGGQVPNYAIGEISDAEVDGLIFMREEEKLARDVYLTLYDQWGLQAFSNIASSEQTHTDSVKALLDMYGIDDPVQDDTIGVFVNEDLQTLYDELIATGSQSLVDALNVGAAIEEIDILDLIENIDKTEEANIEWVYENLKAGSENHLRAFVSQLEGQSGTAYEPQYLSQALYDEIMSSSNGRGGNGGGGHGNGRGRGK